MQFSLDQLRGFVTVAEELHFGRAAERLRMTQPPLSRQVQKLEASVGARLLERGPRSVGLTAAGAAFLVEARRILSLAESAPALARRVSDGAAGVVRIGFTAASTFGVLGGLLDRLARTLPDIEIELSEMVTRDQLAALRNEEIDLGLARPPFDGEFFASRVLFREPLVVALPAGHRLTGSTHPLGPEDLRTEPIIMHSPTRARYFYDLVVSLVAVPPQNVVHTVGQILTMLWLVEANRGLAFVPDSARRLGIAGVEYRALDMPRPDPVELHLLWPRTSTNPALASVVDALVAGS